MKTEDVEWCASCKFWEEHRDNVEETGNCARFPPILDIIGRMKNLGNNEDIKTDSSAWAFPCTLRTDWCGEFIFREEKK